MNTEIWTLICLILISVVLFAFLVCFLIAFCRLLEISKKLENVLDKLGKDLSFLSGVSDKFSKVSRIFSMPLISTGASIFYAILAIRKRHKGGK
ncbi:MAG: hypothetical protein LBH29_00785 [Elusimicrobiota bacterium]|jgi:hypothetical protein|nr:hypothetical protein [Elusimicrobiota bacterium]